MWCNDGYQIWQPMIAGMCTPQQIIWTGIYVEYSQQQNQVNLHINPIFVYESIVILSRMPLTWKARNYVIVN